MPEALNTMAAPSWARRLDRAGFSLDDVTLLLNNDSMSYEPLP